MATKNNPRFGYYCNYCQDFFRSRYTSDLKATNEHQQSLSCKYQQFLRGESNNSNQKIEKLFEGIHASDLTDKLFCDGASSCFDL